MEDGVVLALRDIAEQAGLRWETRALALKQDGRLHIETYGSHDDRSNGND